MTKDLAKFDYADYYMFEWTGYRDQPAHHPVKENNAVGLWLATPRTEYRNTLPCLYIREVLEEEEWTNAERTMTGEINDCMGLAAKKRYTGWISLEIMMSFCVRTSIKMDTTNKAISWWNELFDKNGLIELLPDELSLMKSFEAHLDDLSELSRTAVLEEECNKM